jgi:predicted secreted hydrolase
MKKIGLLIISLLLAALLGACGSDSATKEAFPTPVTNPKAGEIAMATAGPVPGTVVKFPEDEAPHNNLTEWWYYTGHIITTDGQRYGFEYVIFQALRGILPPLYASHFAITDPNTGVFKYDQTTRIGDKVTPGGTGGFDLKTSLGTLSGLNGVDYLKAAMKNEKSQYAIDFVVRDNQGVVLHGGGQFTYGPGGASYYYSRPQMIPTGTITIDGQTKTVKEGVVWFDHQWGDFIPMGGGWDWFSTQLEDGTSLMLYQLRDEQGKLIQVFGSYIPPCQEDCRPDKPIKVVDLDADSIAIKATSQWVSPKTGVTYPNTWNVKIKGDAQKAVSELELNYTPTIPNQELDTRASTVTIYWEGDTMITGTKNGKPITGSGYVELTGYNNKK